MSCLQGADATDYAEIQDHLDNMRAGDSSVSAAVDMLHAQHLTYATFISEGTV